MSIIIVLFNRFFLVYLLNEIKSICVFEMNIVVVFGVIIYVLIVMCEKKD